MSTYINFNPTYSYSDVSVLTAFVMMTNYVESYMRQNSGHEGEIFYTDSFEGVPPNLARRCLQTLVNNVPDIHCRIVESCNADGSTKTVHAYYIHSKK